MFSNCIYWSSFSFIISFKINVNQCKKVSIAAFSLLAFFDFIDLLTFSSLFRCIEKLRVAFIISPSKPTSIL